MGILGSVGGKKCPCGANCQRERKGEQCGEQERVWGFHTGSFPVCMCQKRSVSPALQTALEKVRKVERAQSLNTEHETGSAYVCNPV